jgi:hypothetical protein
VRCVLRDKLAESLAIGVWIGKHHGEANAVVHKLLKQLAGESRAKVKELWTEILFSNHDTASPEAPYERIIDVARGSNDASL